MDTRYITLPAEPFEPVEIVDVVPIPLGSYEKHEVTSGIALWVGKNGGAPEMSFNRRAHALWTQRFGPRADVLTGPAVLTGGADDTGSLLGLTDEQISTIEKDLLLARVHIENTYEDGHTSQRQFLIGLPSDLDDPEEIEAWWEDEVFSHTGDSHGAAHPKLGSLHEVTVLSGPAQLVGETKEWG